MLKKILWFVVDLLIVFGIVLAFGVWFAACVAGVALYLAFVAAQRVRQSLGFVAVAAQKIWRFFGFISACFGVVLLWVAYRLSERNEESESDDYAY